MAGSPFRFAVAVTTLGTDPRTSVPAARQLGFSGVQFDARNAGLDLTALSGTGRREFLHILSSQGQELAALRAVVGPRGFGPDADVDQQLDTLGKVVEASAALAARLVCVDVGQLWEPPVEVAPRPRISQEQAGVILIPPPPTPIRVPESPADSSPKSSALSESTRSALMALGGLADRFGVIVVFRSELASMAALDHVLREVNCPWFGIDLDPAAMLRDRWNFDEILSRLGALVRHVRGRDAVRGTDHRTRATVIGHGDVKWPQLLGDLETGGFSGWISVDPIDLIDRAGAAASAVKYLKGLR